MLTFSLLVWGEDYFRFYAPTGGVYMNASFEQDETVQVDITVEHEGVAISDWFMALSTGNSGDYTTRIVEQGSYSLDYQVYIESPPSTSVMMAPPQSLTVDNVITSTDFSAVAATVEQVSFTIYFYLESGQFSASGDYTDTLTLTLYEGDYSDSGTHVEADSTDIVIYGRMAELIDIYADRESDISYMDLTTDSTDKLIATVYERSNSNLGYEVTIRSTNMAADSTATSPFMDHESSADRLEYSLTYDSVAVTGWSSGSALITDSSGITSPEWLSKELDLSYTGDPDLASGEYEDILTVIITAK
ncbi:MAG: spore coat protein U domain-containing protein [Spirochaetales bacterium]|nr:spore coat protein U domain-containing protein [Spirochaetales bacterium]